MTDFLAQEFYGNTVQQYAIALGIIFGGILFVWLFRRRLLNQVKTWTEKTETKLDDCIIRGIENFGLPILIFVAISAGLSFLIFTEKASHRNIWIL